MEGGLAGTCRTPPILILLLNYLGLNLQRGKNTKSPLAYTVLYCCIDFSVCIYIFMQLVVLSFHEPYFEQKMILYCTRSILSILFEGEKHTRRQVKLNGKKMESGCHGSRHFFQLINSQLSSACHDTYQCSYLCLFVCFQWQQTLKWWQHDEDELV